MKQRALASLLVLVMATSALAAVDYLAYRELRPGDPAPTLSHDGVSSVTSASWDTPADPQQTVGNQTLAVAAAFTTAGTTCEVTVGLYHRSNSGTYTWLCNQSVTLTAQDADAQHEVEAGVYSAVAPALFDTLGATYYDLRLTTAPTNGTVDLRPWLVGHASKGQD